jgi:hypothetical protein
VRIARVVSALTLVVATTITTGNLMSATPAWGNPDLICHGTGSATNPFVLIDVPTNSAHFRRHLPAGRDVLPTFVNGVPNCPNGAGVLAPAAVVPSGPFDEVDFDTFGFANANGGNAGSARGGDGGRGGTGTLPICNQNTNDDWDWWEAPVVDCAAGGIGGDAGDAGISEGGDAGLAFTVGFF